MAFIELQSNSVCGANGAGRVRACGLEWGGWGYRGSLGLLKRAAVALRTGPGIRIDLRDGIVLVVTIEGPETPGALPNAESQRLHSPAKSA